MEKGIEIDKGDDDESEEKPVNDDLPIFEVDPDTVTDPDDGKDDNLSYKNGSGAIMTTLLVLTILILLCCLLPCCLIWFIPKLLPNSILALLIFEQQEKLKKWKSDRKARRMLNMKRKDNISTVKPDFVLAAGTGTEAVLSSDD